MRRLVMIVAVVGAWAVGEGRALGQVVIENTTPPRRVNASIALPNLYGTSWGVASYGVPRMESAFASPYGAGYGYGYGSYSVLPGRYGVGLWRPGFTAPGYSYGSAYGYNTFPYPYVAGGPRYGPPIGVYAPGFGPGGSVGAYSY